jgi:ferredoxin
MDLNNQKCKSCGQCVEVCDFEAIEPLPSISGGYAGYTITKDCVDCGACIDVCPGDAIS